MMMFSSVEDYLYTMDDVRPCLTSTMQTVFKTEILQPTTYNGAFRCGWSLKNVQFSVTVVWCKIFYQNLSIFLGNATNPRIDFIQFTVYIPFLRPSINRSKHNHDRYRTQHTTENVDTCSPHHCAICGTTCLRLVIGYGSFRRKDSDVQRWNSGVWIPIGPREDASLQEIRARLQAPGNRKMRRGRLQERKHVTSDI